MLISPNQAVHVDSVEFWYEDLAYRRLRLQRGTDLRYRLHGEARRLRNIKNYKNIYVESKDLFFLSFGIGEYLDHVQNASMDKSENYAK